MILDRLGFDEDMIIAGLLHDVVEDTDTTLGEIGQRFGLRVADLVAQCSEVKLDSHGQTRPWIDRKRGYLEVLTEAPVEARCLALADKLHNLYSIQLDLSEGRPVWSSFHADRPQVLWYYRAVVETCRVDADSQLERLADECLQVLAAIELVGDVAKK